MIVVMMYDFDLILMIQRMIALTSQLTSSAMLCCDNMHK